MDIIFDNTIINKSIFPNIYLMNQKKILSRTNSQIYKLPPRIITAPSIKNNINIISGFQNTSNIHNNIYGRSIYKKNGF